MVRDLLAGNRDTGFIDRGEELIRATSDAARS